MHTRALSVVSSSRSTSVLSQFELLFLEKYSTLIVGKPISTKIMASALKVSLNGISLVAPQGVVLYAHKHVKLICSKSFCFSEPCL